MDKMYAMTKTQVELKRVEVEGGAASDRVALAGLSEEVIFQQTVE